MRHCQIDWSGTQSCSAIISSTQLSLHNSISSWLFAQRPEFAQQEWKSKYVSAMCSTTSDTSMTSTSRPRFWENGVWSHHSWLSCNFRKEPTVHQRFVVCHYPQWGMSLLMMIHKYLMPIPWFNANFHLLLVIVAASLVAFTLPPIWTRTLTPWKRKKLGTTAAPKPSCRTCLRNGWMWLSCSQHAIDGSLAKYLGCVMLSACLLAKCYSKSWRMVQVEQLYPPACGLLRLLGLIIWFWCILMMVMMLMWSGWPSKLSPNCRINNPETSSSKQNGMIPLAVSCHQCLIYHHTLTSTGFGTGKPRCLMERFTKSIASCTANPVKAASAQCMARWRLHVAINQHLKIRLKADTWLSSSVYVYIYIISIFISIYVYCISFRLWDSHNGYIIPRHCKLKIYSSIHVMRRSIHHGHITRHGKTRLVFDIIL